MRHILHSYPTKTKAAEGTSPRTVHFPTMYPDMRHILHPDPIQANESLAALLEKETVYARRDYLAGLTAFDHRRGVSANDRLLLVDWMYSIVDQCDVSLR